MLVKYFIPSLINLSWSIRITAIRKRFISYSCQFRSKIHIIKHNFLLLEANKSWFKTITSTRNKVYVLNHLKQQKNINHGAHPNILTNFYSRITEKPIFFQLWICIPEVTNDCLPLHTFQSNGVINGSNIKEYYIGAYLMGDRTVKHALWASSY